MRNKLLSLDKPLSAIRNYLFPVSQTKTPKPMLLPSFVHVLARMKGAKAKCKMPTHTKIYVECARLSGTTANRIETNSLILRSAYHRGQKHTLTMSILPCLHIVYRRPSENAHPTPMHSSGTPAIHSQRSQYTQEPSKQMTMAFIERCKSFLYHLLMVFPYNRLIEYDLLPQEHVFSHKQYFPEWLPS